MFIPMVSPVARIPQGAVSFDGSSQYLSRGADLTGNADGKEGTVSLWAYHTSNASDDHILGHDRFRCGFEPGTFRVYGKNSGGTDIIDIGTSSPVTLNAWRHIIASWNLATGSRHIYVQDSSDVTAFTFANDTIDYTRSDFEIAKANGLSQNYVGYLAELWFHPTYIDITNSTNRRKFITAAGKPEFVGNNGQIPLGIRPLIYCAGKANTWNQNKGSGGGFTVNGTALSDAPSTPW